MNIVVISPHPDDETLGAGGLLLKYKRAGHKIFGINVTDIDESSGYSSEMVMRRKEQISSVKEFFDFDAFYNCKLRPTKIDQYTENELVTLFYEIFKTIKPNWVILPDYNDAHSDHRKIYDCAIACTKAFRMPEIKRIMTMEILSESNFGRPDRAFCATYYEDISDCFDKKIEALKIYDTELGEAPFPRSLKAIEALATLRGTEAGVKYAEAFRIIKMIEK